MKCKNEKGITLIVLAVTIIIMLIIASIAIYAGTESIKNAKLEALKTNMLLIQAKAKEYVEEVSFKIGVTSGVDATEVQNRTNQARTEIYINDAQLEAVTDTSKIPGLTSENTYKVGQEALKKMGLEQIENTEGEYWVTFDEENCTVEVYNTEGYQGKYSLTDIENIN